MYEILVVSFVAFQIAVVLKGGFECTNECLISYRVLLNHSALVATAKVLKPEGFECAKCI